MKFRLLSRSLAIAAVSFFPTSVSLLSAEFTPGALRHTATSESKLFLHETNQTQAYKIAGFWDGFVCAVGIRRSVSNFKPLPKYRDRQGFLTDGNYRVDRVAMLPHETGSLASGKSQFLNQYTGYSADVLVLDAAELSDRLCLWRNNKAKVQVLNSPIGILGNGTPTNWINVYRNSRGLVHGSPGTPLP